MDEWVVWLYVVPHCFGPSSGSGHSQSDYTITLSVSESNILRLQLIGIRWLTNYFVQMFVNGLVQSEERACRDRGVRVSLSDKLTIELKVCVSSKEKSVTNHL